MAPLDSEQSQYPTAETDAPKRRKTPAWRLWVFRAAAAILVPALFLGLLEGGLRIFGYGHPTEFFVKVDGRDTYTTNQRFGWRFFSPAISRNPAVCEFPTEKPNGTYRIFVLGGSAAMGTPQTAFSFGRMLEAMLQDRFPDTRFTVINAAMTAINSHVVLPIARDCARYEGDLFIIYMGNNEVTGPYGSGTIFQQFSGNLWVIRAGVFVKSTRIGQLIGSLLGGGADGPTHWQGMEMFLEQRVAGDDPRMEKVYAHFRANLEDICGLAASSGAKVILCTVAVNMKDCAPFASMHRSDLSDSDLAKWKQRYKAAADSAQALEHARAIEQFLAAAKIDERPAELHFRMARSYMALQRFKEAGKHFVLARDLDALRFRADTRINETIRHVGGSLAGRGIFLVDTERALQQADPGQHGFPGQELFYEHVHMTPEGNYLLAATMFRQVVTILPEKIRGSGSGPVRPPSQKRCFELIALTDWDRYRMQYGMFDMQKKPPFTGQLDYMDCRTERGRRLAEIKRRGTSPAALKAAHGLYAAAIARSGDDLFLRYNFADLLSQRGDHQGALEQRRTILERFPQKAGWRIALGETLEKLGKPDEAVTEYERVIRLDSHAATTTNAYCRIGLIRFEQSKLTEAADSFTRALAIDPELAGAHNSLGGVLFRQGETQQAVERFRKALECDPTLIAAYHNLAIVCDKQDDLPGAAECYRQAIETDPQALESYRLLTSVLERQGKSTESLDQYRRMVEANPGSAEAHSRLGSKFASRKRWPEAAEQFRHVVRIEPDDIKARHNLASFLSFLGKTDEAIEQYRQVLARKSDFELSVRALARILATDHDPDLRDGAEALRLIKPLCERSGRQVPAMLDVLAAAYAETGRFDQAIAAARKAIRWAKDKGNASLVAKLEKRLSLYEKGKPYHTEQRGNKSTTP